MGDVNMAAAVARRRSTMARTSISYVDGAAFRGARRGTAAFVDTGF